MAVSIGFTLLRISAMFASDEKVVIVVVVIFVSYSKGFVVVGRDRFCILFLSSECVFPEYVCGKLWKFNTYKINK